MTGEEHHSSGQISLMALGSILIRDRWRIARWAILGGLLVAASVLFRPALYRATASFIPQGTDPDRQGLLRLAGQFGVSLAEGNQGFSPEFYAELLGSRVLLLGIVRDTVHVEELEGQRVAFLDLLEVRDEEEGLREEVGLERLRELIRVSVGRNTNIVTLSVDTRWQSVSLAIASSLVEGVNRFNQRTRQEQAATEREFVEERLALAAAELREAEDRLEEFLRGNRQYASSPELSFERDRLQREVAMRQQVYTSLTESYEEVRIREVRDTPVIMLVQPPSVPATPEPRRRLILGVFGLVLGGFIGVLISLASEMITRRRREGDQDTEEFLSSLTDLRESLRESFRRVQNRS